MEDSTAGPSSGTPAPTLQTRVRCAGQQVFLPALRDICGSRQAGKARDNVNNQASSCGNGALL
jgi:hypothetical protein